MQHCESTSNLRRNGVSSESNTGFIKGVFATIGAIAALVAIYEFMIKPQSLPPPVATPRPVASEPVERTPSSAPGEPTTVVVVVTATAQPQAPIPPTATRLPQIEVSEILPRGIKTANEMPDWLSQNVGGNANQWKRLDNGKWRFRAGNAGGSGENQILSPKEGYLLFGADSGKKDSNGAVIWTDTTIGPGETTFWRCGEPNKPGPIDAADWTLFNPNIYDSCKTKTP
jgi:hypothetical protein